MSAPTSDLTNPGRPSAMACLMAGILLPALALFGVLIVSFIDRDAETVDGLSEGTVVGILVGPVVLLAAAAVTHIRGATRRRRFQADLNEGSLLLTWTYGDADVAVAHRIWETARRRRGGRVFMAVWLPAMIVAGAGWTPLTLPMALVYGGVVGLTGLAWRGFHLYFLDRASGADGRRVLIWSTGVWARGDGLLFGGDHRDLELDHGRWGSEALVVLSFSVRGSGRVLVPVPRDRMEAAAEVVTWFEEKGQVRDAEP